MRTAFMGTFVAIACWSGLALAQTTPPTSPPRAGQPKAIDQQGTTERQQPRTVAPGQPNGRATTAAGETGGAASGSDQQIAALIFGAAHNEIEIAKFAQSKLQSEQAKQFAAKMIRDHQPGCDAMKQLAGNLVAHETAPGGPAHAPANGAAAGANAGTRGQTAPTRPGETAATEPAGARTGREVGAGTHHAAAAGATNGGLDWVSIHQEIGAQCLATTKKELSEQPTADFDKCFMSEQIMAHMVVIDKLEVLQRYASSELQQKIGEEIQMAKGHFQEAKQIMDQLKERPTERVSRNPKQ